jgi:acetoin utilization protein AcuB
MLVREFMTTKVTCLQDTDTLLDASMLFLRSQFRHIPVVQGKQVVGIITERDVKQFVPTHLRRITPDEYNQLLETTPLSKVMTRDPITIMPDQSMFEAATILHNKRVGCLPVVENNELVGVISTTDMLRLLVRLLNEKGNQPLQNSPGRV